MLLPVLAVEQVGVEIGQQCILGPVGRAKAVSQGVVSHRLGGDLLGRRSLNHLLDQCLGFLELLEANEALGLGQLRLVLGWRAVGQRTEKAIKLGPASS